ncbi:MULTISPECIES: SH3 domain-containing protein [Sphingomonas]|uniref:SH3 domain-containing protein n=1 Tax=Sphingomonas TaxID=13687 RepID=UPI000DEFA9AE|nr:MULTISPECIES: SH3 domain-containing protein [Sphingomonas]
MPTAAAAAPRSASSLTATNPPPGGWPLAGPSNLPDPRTHAYRQDLADVALVGTVIASHFAEPLNRELRSAAPLLQAPAADAAVITDLPAGTTLRMLDNSRGWAWGYADGLVGYVRSEAVR